MQWLCRPHAKACMLYAVVLDTAFRSCLCVTFCAVSRHGQGSVSRGDGYQYSGQWLQDLPHGQGLSTSAPCLLQLSQSTA